MKRLKMTSCLFCLLLIIMCVSCTKTSEKGAYATAASLMETEFSFQKMESLSDVQFRVLKTETFGYKPLHKFYWICLPKKINNQKVVELSKLIVKEIISVQPGIFHSITIHFYHGNEMTKIPDRTRNFARADFLPEGSWQKVGRIPIEDYKSYSLTCTFHEQEKLQLMSFFE